MRWAKILLQLLLPYLVDLLKHIYAQLTLRKYRQKRGVSAAKKSEQYSQAQSDQEIERTYENLP